MYLPYVYYIRNTITNQFYYGSRYKNVKLCRTAADDLWHHYTTSSKRVNALVDQYGLSSFEIKILKEDADYSVCYWYEQELIAANISDTLCLNKTFVVPNTNNQRFSFVGQQHTAEYKNSMSVAQSGNNNSFFGKKHTAENNAKRIAACVAARTGTHHTTEAKEKARITMLSKPKVTCPHCLTTGHSSIMKRWHFDKCQKRST